MLSLQMRERLRVSDSSEENSKKAKSDEADPGIEEPKEKGTEIIPAESAEELMQLLDKLSPKQLQQILDAHPRINKRVEMSYSGPLPTPEAFQKYNEVQPDAADRIIRMAEKEQQIRNDAQQGAIRNDKGRIYATLFTNILLLGVAGFAIYSCGICNLQRSAYNWHFAWASWFRNVPIQNGVEVSRRQAGG